MIDALSRLYRHMYWADARVLAALRGPGAATPRALEIYAHVLGGEHIWHARIVGAAPTHAVWPALTLGECAALAADNQAAYEALLSSRDDASLEWNVHYRNSAGDAFDSKLSDILLHVALHGMHHRGQVTLLIRDAGCEPAATDYIALARGAPAATRRP